MANANPTKLNTIDGETLMSKPLQPLNFVVDTLLSQGLHILAGSPKVGKSWLALWLAVMVAKGEPVWGMPVKGGTTLYLCLEDSQLRIQNRLFDVTEDAPANVHFCTESRILGDGLTEQLEQFLAEHPDTSLIIIDTLQMIRALSGSTTTSSPSTRRSRSPVRWRTRSRGSSRSRPGRTARCSLPPTSTPLTSTRTSWSTPCAMRPGRCCGRAPVLCVPSAPSPTSCA